MGQTRSIIIGLALVLGQTAIASAEGLDPPPPPVVEPVCATCAGPIYLKGFVGAANPNVGNIFFEEMEFNDFEFFHMDIKNSALFGLGVGYQFNSWFRFDVTGEYRGRSAFFAQDRYPGGDGTFNGNVLNPNPGGFNPGTNEYTADIESWVGLVNGYVDLGKWWCVTPYVGGGLGFASLSVLGLKDVNVPNLGVAYATDHSDTNFAWAVYAGLAYDVTPGLTIDLSYRYTDLGDTRSGNLIAYDNSFIDGAPVHINDITSHDLMLGVRMKLGHEPAVAPMPVAFK